MQHPSEGFPSETPPATHFLGMSPPFVGLQTLTNQYLASGLEAGGGCVVVTTNRSVHQVVDALGEYTTEAARDRIAVVDATRQEYGRDDIPCRFESVSSPADLTGIGIGLSKHLESLWADDVSGVRVVIDSLSALLVYAGFESVFKFVHAVTNQINRVDGSSIALIAEDADEPHITKLETLFDGTVETRAADAGREYRLSLRGDVTDWRPLPTTSATPAADARTETTQAEPAAPDTANVTVGTYDSLGELIETMEAAGLTLTLCNYDETDEAEENLRDYLGRFNVDVRRATLSTESPANVALLHQGDDVYATSAVSDLLTAIRVEDPDGDGDLSAMTRPDVLDAIQRDEYAVEDGSKLEMIRISRLIETRALDAGTGALHTGFQRLDRIDDEYHTRELYEAIAEAGVDVHVYGSPGALPNEEYYTAHTAATGELTRAWFVVFDGDGSDARKAAMVSEESGANRYTGFWTYRPDVVDSVDTYLRRQYGDGSA